MTKTIPINWCKIWFLPSTVLPSSHKFITFCWWRRRTEESCNANSRPTRNCFAQKQYFQTSKPSKIKRDYIWLLWDTVILFKGYFLYYPGSWSFHYHSRILTDTLYPFQNFQIVKSKLSKTLSNTNMTDPRVVIWPSDNQKQTRGPLAFSQLVAGAGGTCLASSVSINVDCHLDVYIYISQGSSQLARFQT